MIRILATLLAVLLMSAPIRAEEGKSGLAPNRVKLPQGPGSLEGIGENAEPNLSMGLVSYGVPLAVPDGYQGFSPRLALGYSSAGGASVVGMGWAFDVPKIERMTSRGLPEYGPGDLVAADGGQELVRVPGTNWFRARDEKGFVRYEWLEAADGRAGYWKAEYPDGSVGYFGADAEGNVADEARIETSAGTFSYGLVEMVDRHDHRLRYLYDKPAGDGRPYLERVEWAFASGAPRYVVELEYEARPDVLSDGKPGVEVRLSRRLRNVRVRVRGELLRRYRLSYEPESVTGGLSRLSRVETFGSRDDATYPVSFGFSYTGAFDPVCEGGTCSGPYVQELGSVGVNFAAGHADLVDLNQDHLPDIIDTRDGEHRIFLQTIDESGQRFEPVRVSATAGSGAMDLASPSVHMVDLDGNGGADILDGLNGRVLFNGGSGDWEERGAGDPRLPDFAADENLRFFDVDHDRYIDCIHIGPTGAWYYKNERNQRFATEAVPLDLSGVGFTENGLRLADVNGDGLLDLVQPLEGGWAYRMSLGHGRFSPPLEMLGLPTDWDPSQVEWVDLDGDNLTDAVLVLGQEVRYALNRNGREFAAPVVITSAAGRELPERTPETSLRFADMNGSGSTDVVWIGPSGEVSFLELFPRRPHLLSRIENGIGKVTELHYGTSTDHMARDGGPSAWAHHVPHVMITLDRMDAYDTRSGVRQIERFHYSDGYYDGSEHQFHGFAQVEVQRDGDGSTEAGLTRHEFDVGVEDRYRKGLLLRQETWSGGRSLTVSEHEYGDCPVAEVPSETALPVRHLCALVSEEELREGSAPGEWIRSRREMEYDGYGNVTVARDLGVVSRGGGGCGPCQEDPNQSHGAPCGGSCLGDESFAETHYIEPGSPTGGRWLLRLPSRELRYGVAGAPRQQGGVYWEQRTYYDGDPFEGLPGGSARVGNVSRSTVMADGESLRVVTSERHQYDEHGNVLGSLDPNGNLRAFAYDDEGLLLLHEDVVLGGGRGLRQAVSYDPVYEQPITTTAWMRTQGEEVVSEPRRTRYAYDQFGRLTKIARPGDDLSAPTEEFIYELADPVSRIVRRVRSGSGSSPDLESIQCFDGMGRELQTRQLIEPGRYRVSGFEEYNVQGDSYRTLQPYESPAGGCALRAPESVLSTARTFDALGRVLEEELPDAGSYGGRATRLRTEYLPLRTLAFDGEDTDQSSDHRDTPTALEVDGQGRTVRIERLLDAGGPAVVTEFSYDTLGHLSRVIDDEGNVKQQHHDLLGRPLLIDDPDTGTTRHEYDDAGNLVRSTDARGISVVTEYDSANRPLRQYEPGDVEKTLSEWFYDELAGCAPEDCSHPEGQLVAMRYPLPGGERGEDRFGFDRRGRDVFSERTLEGYAFRFRREFDNADRLVAMVYPTGQRVEVELDGSDRAVAIPGYVERVGYDGRQLLAELELVNGVHTVYDYDENLRLSSLVTHRGRALVQSYRYERDRADNITAIADDRDPSHAATANAEYTYDALYRLTHALIEPEVTSRVETLDVVYDGIDNIQSKVSSRGLASGAHVGDYRYGQRNAGPHAVSRAGHKTYLYDEAGNQILRHQHSLTWDHLGRLTQARHENRLLGRFGYDAARQRVVKHQGAHTTLYVAPDFEVRDGVSTLYVMGPAGRVAKVEDASLAAELLGDDEGNGFVSAGTAYLRFHQNAGEPPAAADVRRAEHQLASSARQILLEEGGRTTFLHHDHLGSAAVTTDGVGRVVQQTEHYPYGSIRAQREYLEDYSFTGQERDAFTGLSYHGARYLDTALGRWTAADPLFVGASEHCLERPEECNGYGYAQGSPVRLRDTSGYMTVAEFIDQRGEAAAGRGSRAATFGWAYASAAWSVLGAESVSKVADSFISGRDDVTATDWAGAALETGIVGKGVQVAGKAVGGVYRGASSVVGRVRSARGTGGTAGGSGPNLVRHGPLNPGPLSERVANTFRGGSYTAETLSEATTLYRVYGGKVGETGSYWTRTKPSGPVQSIIDSALSPQWGNTATNVATVRVPAGTTIYDGAAAAQGGLVGGGSQVFIPDVNAAWLVP